MRCRLTSPFGSRRSPTLKAGSQRLRTKHALSRSWLASPFGKGGLRGICAVAPSELQIAATTVGLRFGRGRSVMILLVVDDRIRNAGTRVVFPLWRNGTEGINPVGGG